MFYKNWSHNIIIMITRQLKITPYHDDTIHIIVYFTV